MLNAVVRRTRFVRDLCYRFRCHHPRWQAFVAVGSDERAKHSTCEHHSRPPPMPAPSSYCTLGAALTMALPSVDFRRLHKALASECSFAMATKDLALSCSVNYGPSTIRLDNILFSRFYFELLVEIPGCVHKSGKNKDFALNFGTLLVVVCCCCWLLLLLGMDTI